MQTWFVFVLAAMMAVTVHAAPTRVVLMDFEDQSGGSMDQSLGGMVNSEQLASKGIYALSRELLEKGDFVLIDRRDFMKQMQEMETSDAGKPSGIKTSYIQAAQALRADVILRGVLQSFSTGKEKINQGGYQADFATVTVRVVVEAVDAVDGSILAMAEGFANERFRQTAAKQTELGEDEVLQLMQRAINNAIPELSTALNARMETNANRGRVMLAVNATENPAMVEVDGVLVGTTPFENLEVYKGDHVFSVTRPGYQTITKRIVLEGNTKIEVPMLRTDLTADEKKEVMEQADMRMYFNEGGRPDFVIQTID